MLRKLFCTVSQSFLVVKVCWHSQLAPRGQTDGVEVMPVPCRWQVTGDTLHFLQQPDNSKHTPWRRLRKSDWLRTRTHTQCQCSRLSLHITQDMEKRKDLKAAEAVPYTTDTTDLRGKKAQIQRLKTLEGTILNHCVFNACERLWHTE